MDAVEKSVAVLIIFVAALANTFLTTAQAVAPNVEQRQQAWRASIARTPPPARGCFTASYPLLVWTQVHCVTVRPRPYLPALGGAPHAGVTGAGNDYAAVSRKLISFAVGSFPEVKNLKSETGAGGMSNSYTLQLNSNFMLTDPLCAGAPNPNCAGWQQFVYSTGEGKAFIQYWLNQYGDPCPAGKWRHPDKTKYKDYCYMTSKGVSVPLQVIAELSNLKLSAHAVTQGIDGLVLTTKTKAYSTVENDNVLFLASGWTASEFNVFGDANGSQADFNAGAKLTVEIDLANGSTKKPECKIAGTTGETNNLTLGEKCNRRGGASPSISFTEMQTSQVDTFDPPGSIDTEPYSINDGGVIAGYYSDSNRKSHGFVRAPDGTITTFDVPGSSGMSANSINNVGAVAGTYYSDGNRGFVRTGDGAITAFDVPGSSATFASSINIGNSIVGYYYNSGTFHGFLRAPDGSFTSFDPPGSKSTYVSSVNASGSIAGFYFSDTPHGFVRAPDGTITTIDVPGSRETEVLSVNAKGTIAGDYADDKTLHGFVRAADGTTILFDPPGSTYTEALWINDHDDITGIYLDSNGVTHGYVRAADRTIAPFDPPGSIDTRSLSININGVTTGNYRDSNGVVHGFVRSP